MELEGNDMFADKKRSSLNWNVISVVETDPDNGQSSDTRPSITCSRPLEESSRRVEQINILPLAEHITSSDSSNSSNSDDSISSVAAAKAEALRLQITDIVDNILSTATRNSLKRKVRNTVIHISDSDTDSEDGSSTSQRTRKRTASASTSVSSISDLPPASVSASASATATVAGGKEPGYKAQMEALKPAYVLLERLTEQVINFHMNRKLEANKRLFVSDADTVAGTSAVDDVTDLATPLNLDLDPENGSRGPAKRAKQCMLRWKMAGLQTEDEHIQKELPNCENKTDAITKTSVHNSSIQQQNAPPPTLTLEDAVSSVQSGIISTSSTTTNQASVSSKDKVCATVTPAGSSGKTVASLETLTKPSPMPGGSTSNEVGMESSGTSSQIVVIKETSPTARSVKKTVEIEWDSDTDCISIVISRRRTRKKRVSSTSATSAGTSKMGKGISEEKLACGGGDVKTQADSRRPRSSGTVTEYVTIDDDTSDNTVRSERRLRHRGLRHCR